MSAHELYDCVVVGAGIIGSCTAYHLAKLGKKTLLLEQFFLPNSRGGSCGQSRIIRRAYSKHYYGQMIADAYDMWDDMEKESGEKLRFDTGMLIIGKDKCGSLSGEDLKGMVATMKRFNSPFEELTNEQLRSQYPSLRVSKDHKGALDKSAGVLLAEKCVRVVQELAKRYGCTIKDGTKMLEVISTTDKVTVQTNNGDFNAKSVVIAAGAWADKILTSSGVQLPIIPQRATVMYWKSKDPDLHSAKSGFPSVTVRLEDGRGIFYLLPSLEYPGYCKASFHDYRPDRPQYCDPDERNHEPDEKFRNDVADYVREHFPGLEDKPSIIEYCMYSESPDRDYVLDSHPEYKNIFIATGFSGHGFKLGPTVGKILAEMATKSQVSYDLSPFKISRFLNGHKSNL